MLHSNLRDCEAWRDIGLPLSTTSNEACKTYDALLTQWIRSKNIPSFGGIEGCRSKLQAADPDFVMGHVIMNGLDLLGTGRSVLIDKQLDSAVKRMVRLSKARDITERERLHVEALDLFGKGSLPKACEVWEDILLYHPTDILAMKLLFESYFFLGKSTELRDSVARVLHHWTPQIPLYGYLQGMYSFALVETNFYDRAEKIAKEALASAPSEIWSMHSLAHVHYMRADADGGIALMKQTEDKWKDCVMSSVHNYWHWALFHIEKGEYEAALTIFDTHIAKSCHKSGSVVEMVDTSSLLYQLQMEGINVDDRWKELSTVAKNQAEDPAVIYGDVHTLISLVAAKETETADKFMTSLQEIARSPGDNYQHQLTQRLSLPLCQAIREFADGNYSRTVDLLHPIRYQIYGIGGSKPQVDLFNLLLIHAALKSDRKSHQKLARCLLVERDTLRPNSPMTERLIRKATALHDIN